MRCVVLDDIERAAEASADWSGLEVRFLHEHLEETALAEELTEADAIVVMRERTAITSDLLSRLPKLRLIVTTGARNAAIDLAACRERSIVVCSAPGSGSAAAQLTWALLLAAARHLPQAVRDLRSGDWQAPLGIDLEGKRLGVIGLGRLGTAVTRYGQAFGMDTVAWSPHLTTERCAAVGTMLVDLPELLTHSDFVSVHLVAAPSTRGLIGADQFRLMKSSAWLINTSRAALVDTAALVHALRTGEIAGAALDVFDAEPPPHDDPLRTLPNVLATPHIGYVTDRQFADWYAQAAEQLRAFQAGRPVAHVLQ